MKKVAIIKEPSLLREGLAVTLTKKSTDLTVSVYGSSEQHEFRKEENIADLLIIDIDTDIDFLGIIKRYKDKNKQVIVWISNNEDDRLLQLFQRGFDGYFYNEMTSNELISAISSVLEGKCYIHPELIPVLVGDYVRRTSKKASKPTGVLTKREWEILELLSKGHSNVGISQALSISEKTVKNHVSSVLQKLDVADRTNAVLVALKQKWVVL